MASAKSGNGSPDFAPAGPVPLVFLFGWRGTAPAIINASGLDALLERGFGISGFFEDLELRRNEERRLFGSVALDLGVYLLDSRIARPLVVLIDSRVSGLRGGISRVNE